MIHNERKKERETERNKKREGESHLKKQPSKQCHLVPNRKNQFIQLILITWGRGKPLVFDTGVTRQGKTTM